MIEYGINTKGAGLHVFEPVTLGFPSRDYMGKTEFTGTTIGKDAVLRSGTLIYCDVTIGDWFQTGHNVIIREKTRIGNHVSVGTGVIIEGNTRIGDNVNLQSMVYIPTNTSLGDRVFIGPNAVLTNDRYPPSGIGGLVGPVIERGAAIGANATILPGIHIGEGALVAAAAVVTRDVPAHMLAVGAPAKIQDLPSALGRKNQKNADHR
ncbi:MAG: acyltransferase [Methanoregula sp.]|uniref:acyltransferase n=1 Tax=Methanoregula sp. TaxID=2052170 RepID=UPI003BAEAAF2